MSSRLRLLLSSFVMCISVIACSESNAPESNTASNQATTTAHIALENAQIEAGMTEDQVKAILGDPKLIQTRTIDDLTITYSEWTDKSGKTSVQFQNGKVMFNQFFPTSEE